jgi:hypothetical protein
MGRSSAIIAVMVVRVCTSARTNNGQDLRNPSLCQRDGHQALRFSPERKVQR